MSAEAEFHIQQLIASRDRAERLAEAADAECDRLRAVLAEVQYAFNLQCPPMPAEKYVDRGAWMAHSWWSRVLGGILERAGLADGGVA